jgi:hypothetical protein
MPAATDVVRPNGALSFVRRLAEAADVLNKLGTSTILLLLLGVFLMAYFGYIRSPLQDLALGIKGHDVTMREAEIKRLDVDWKVAQALTLIGMEMGRMNKVQQIRLCAEIKEPDLRRRCLE